MALELQKSPPSKPLTILTIGLSTIILVSHHANWPSDFKTVLQEFLPYLRHLSLSPCYAIMRWLVACSHKHYYIAVSLYLCLLYVLYLIDVYVSYLH